MLIEVEGITGSGKTTQCERMKSILEHAKFTATIVNEPGMTEMGTFIMKAIKSNTPRDKVAELFLSLAVEAELHSQIIIPEHSIPGHLVLRDGGSGSFISYHYLTTQFSLEKLTRLYDQATLGHRSIMTIFLDVPLDVAAKRIKNRRKESKFDMLPLVFIQRQRDVFMHLSQTLPNWVVVDGTKPAINVRDQILSKIQDRVNA